MTIMLCSRRILREALDRAEARRRDRDRGDDREKDVLPPTPNHLAIRYHAEVSAAIVGSGSGLKRQPKDASRSDNQGTRASHRLHSFARAHA